MTILSACQDAGFRLQGQRPASVFSTSEIFPLELSALANETLADLVEYHDWRALTLKNTYTGDDATTSFPLPSDYARMPVQASVYSSRSLTPFSPVTDLDQWLEFEVQAVAGYPGYWIVLADAFQVLPVPGASETVKFYYISKNAAVSSGGVRKEKFTADLDTCVFPERLITLGVIWRWRAMKRMEYAEDMKNYELAVSAAAGRDKGSRVLAIGKARLPDGAQTAWPGMIIP